MARGHLKGNVIKASVIKVVLPPLVCDSDRPGRLPCDRQGPVCTCKFSEFPRPAKGNGVIFHVKEKKTGPKYLRPLFEAESLTDLHHEVRPNNLCPYSLFFIFSSSSRIRAYSACNFSMAGAMTDLAYSSGIFPWRAKVLT